MWKAGEREERLYFHWFTPQMPTASQFMARSNAAALNSNQVSHMGGKDQIT